jgi:dephospho-CoA kinase
MIKLGITGGIGSGKTTVCKQFAQLGIPIYNADERAKYLVNHHTDLQKEIILHFGEDSFINGEYNKAYISNIVFKDSQKLKILNHIIHPYVFNDWESFCLTHQASPYVIKEAAIMLETESKNTVDRIVLVYSPMELRIKRVMARDGVEESLVINRIKQQMPEDEKMKLVDYIIYNDDEHSLENQVLNLHQQLTNNPN